MGTTKLHVVNICENEQYHKVGNNTDIKHVNTTLQLAAEYKPLRQYTITGRPLHHLPPSPKNKYMEITTIEMRFQIKYLTLILSYSQILLSTLITPKVMIHIAIFMLSSKSECSVIYLMTLSVTKIIVSILHEQA